jgi:hypothetical protein
VRILIPALASHHRLSAFHRNFATLFDSDRSLKRRATVGPQAFVFGSPDGAFVASFETGWESLLLVANGHDTRRAKAGTRVDRAKLREINLH